MVGWEGRRARWLLILWFCACPARSGEVPPRPADARGPEAGRFDYYTLALTWAPAFCDQARKRVEREECSTQTPERYDASHLVLHGLWPSRNHWRSPADSYEYCGVGEDVWGLGSGSWCRMPPLELSEETGRALAVSMPGRASCLDRHEWYKHGTCSGLKADDYFALASGLVFQVADGHLGRFLAANVGRVVDAEQLTAEFRKDAGGIDAPVHFYCKPKRGGHLLLEVRMYLKNSIPVGGMFREMLTSPEGSARGNCPERFLIGPVRP